MLTLGFPPTRGGIERTAERLAANLNDCRLTVVSGRPVGDRPALSAPAPGVRMHWVHNDPPYGRKALALLLVRAVRVGLRERPQVVLALHIRLMPAARLLAGLIGSRAVLVVHAKEMREQPSLARAAVRWADGIVAVSSFAEQLSLESGADPASVRIIHPGVTPPPGEPASVAVRPPPLTVVSVARMDDLHKGHAVALQAMHDLRRRVPDVRWIMIGDGRLRAGLVAQAAELGLSDSVDFVGAVEDAELDHHLSNAHAFCLLTQPVPEGQAGEGFGIVFIEAGAHALPVVAGDVPGVRDAVRDAETGTLVAPRDPEAAAAALARLLTDLDSAAAVGLRGLERSRDLSWSRVARRYRDFLATVVGSPSRARRCRGAGWLRELIMGPGGVK